MLPSDCAVLYLISDSLSCNPVSMAVTSTLAGNEPPSSGQILITSGNAHPTIILNLLPKSQDPISIPLWDMAGRKETQDTSLWYNFIAQYIIGGYATVKYFLQIYVFCTSSETQINTSSSVKQIIYLIWSINNIKACQQFSCTHSTDMQNCNITFL